MSNQKTSEEVIEFDGMDWSSVIDEVEDILQYKSLRCETALSFDTIQLIRNILSESKPR